MKKKEDIYKNIMNFKCTNIFQNPHFFKKKVVGARCAMQEKDDAE